MKTKCLYFLIAVTLPFFLGTKHQQKSSEGYDLGLRMHFIDVGHGDCILVHMGDAEGKERNDPPSVTKYVEKYLVDNYDSLELRSTVIKVGHHGSETSSTNALIEAAQADYAVIYVGNL
jgi:beta-lactamase superfamily II metal-dependent hydrolase